LMLNGEPVERLQSPTREPLKSTTPLLTAVVAEYERHKLEAAKAWSKRTLEEYRFATTMLLSVVADRPIDAVTKPDLVKFYEHVTTTTNKRGERYSPASVNKLCQFIKGLWKFAAKRDYVERDIAKDVLEHLDEGRAGDQREAFTDAESEAVLAECRRSEHRSRESTPSSLRTYGPLILATMGLRLEEVVRLRRQDVTAVDGIPCLLIRGGDEGRVKTEAGRRTVPLSSRVLASGLLEHVATIASGNLWGLVEDDRKMSAGFSKWLARAIDKVTDDEKKIAHSWRHRAVGKMLAAGVAVHVVEDIVGHERSGSESTTRYGAHGLPVALLRDAVEKIG
jgi:integrase